MRDRTKRILEFQEQQLRRALDEKRVVPERARVARAEQQEYEEMYLNLFEDVVAREKEPSARSLKALLEVGDFDGAIRLKAAQTRRSKSRVKEPGEPSLSALLEAGDFDYAIRLKSAQIEDRKSRVKKLGVLSVTPSLKAEDLDAANRLRTAQINKKMSEVKRLAQDYSELGRVHDLRYRRDDAMEAYRQAWRLDQNEPRYGLAFAYCAQKQNRFGDAETVYKEALSTYRRLTATTPETYLPEVATTLNQLANLYGHMQRMKEAETAYVEALSTRRQLAEADPGAYLPDIANTLDDMAVLYSNTKRMDEAETGYKEALSIRRRLAETDPELYSPNFATTLINLAFLYCETKRMKEANECCDEAQTIYEPLWCQQPEIYGNQMAQIFVVRALLLGADRQSKCDYARRAFEAASDPHFKQVLQRMFDRLSRANRE